MNESGDNNIISFESRKQRWEQGWEDRRAAARETYAKYFRNYSGGEAAFWRDFIGVVRLCTHVRSVRGGEAAFWRDFRRFPW
jgi:hypothetical protein